MPWWTLSVVALSTGAAVLGAALLAGSTTIRVTLPNAISSGPATPAHHATIPASHGAHESGLVPATVVTAQRPVSVTPISRPETGDDTHDLGAPQPTSAVPAETGPQVTTVTEQPGTNGSPATTTTVAPQTGTSGDHLHDGDSTSGT